MTLIRATRIRAVTAVFSLLLLASLGACGKDEVRVTCDDPQPYQSLVASKRIEVPEDLAPLNQHKEMPIPTADSPPRPEGAACIENAPSVLASGAKKD